MRISDWSSDVCSSDLEVYRGLDRYVARKKIVADLDALGLVDKIDDHKLKVTRGDRSGAVVEPYLTDQWFVDLTRETQIGRAHVRTPVANAHLVCRRLLDNKSHIKPPDTHLHHTS